MASGLRRKTDDWKARPGDIGLTLQAVPATYMNRIVVHTSEPSCGAARYVTEFVTGLAANGGDVTLFCPPTFDFISEVRARGVNVVFAAHRSIEPASTFALVARNLKYALGTIRRQLLATRRGDIVHFQFPLYFPAGLAFFAGARWKGCPIVFTAHDPVPHKWLFPRSLRFLELSMLRLAYHLSDGIIVHNETGKHVVVRDFGQNPDKVEVIPHGPLQLAERVEAAPSSGLRLLMFGSIRENKGAHLAVQAVQSLNSGSVSVELTIAGALANAREAGYWKTCRQLIDQNPRGIRVIDRYIENAEIGSLIQEHHALVLPYSNNASESGVAALALTNRRPIIATRAGGLGALLAESECGIPIEGNTAADVADAIVKASGAGPDALRRMGEAGAALMDSGRSWDEIGRRTLGVYGRTKASKQAVA